MRQSNQPAAGNVETVSPERKKEIHNLFTLFYLAMRPSAIFAISGSPSRRVMMRLGFGSGRRGGAAAAYQVGWRDVADKPLCPDCVSHHEHTTN
jgi:hypothetical protein